MQAYMDDHESQPLGAQLVTWFMVALTAGGVLVAALILLGWLPLGERANISRRNINAIEWIITFVVVVFTVGAFRTAFGLFQRERAALAYAEEATRQKRVADETFARLQEHFNNREIVEITLLNAIENYYNLINLPLEIESDGLCAIIAPGRAAKPVAVGK